MKITNDHVARLLGARLERLQSSPFHQPGSSIQAARTDRVTLSSRAQELRIGLFAACATEIEDPRLDALSQEVRAGRYRVPAELVADAMLRDLGR